MAVTVSSSSSFVTLNKCLNVLALSLNANSGLLYKIYTALIVFFTGVTHVIGTYFKLEHCAPNNVIMRYLDYLLYHLRFFAYYLDTSVRYFSAPDFSNLIELLDTLKTCQKKTILCHAILNCTVVFIQVLLFIDSSCSRLDHCQIGCLIPPILGCIVTTAGFFRCFCVLYLMKCRVCEVSEDLFKKLGKTGSGESLSLNTKQVDEVLGGMCAYGKYFGIQLAFQFVDLETVVVQNVVLVKRITMDLPLSVYMLITQRIFSSGVNKSSQNDCGLYGFYFSSTACLPL